MGAGKKSSNPHGNFEKFKSKTKDKKKPKFDRNKPWKRN